MIVRSGRRWGYAYESNRIFGSAKDILPMTLYFQKIFGHFLLAKTLEIDTTTVFTSGLVKRGDASELSPRRKTLYSVVFTESSVPVHRDGFVGGLPLVVVCGNRGGRFSLKAAIPS